MNNKSKLMISLSLAVAIFYSLPWIALNEQFRFTNGLLYKNAMAAERLMYLFFSVFAVSMLFFQYNFYWKHKICIAKNGTVRYLLNLFYNSVILLIACVLLIIISRHLLGINTKRGYLIFYLYRNAGIGLIAMLVTYVFELINKSKQDRIEILTLQNQNAESELTALRAQIDPHFLFNSLTSLSGLIRSNSKDSLVFVEHLAETFRYVLDKRECKVVTLKDELRFLDSYIFMMKQRFGQSLQVTMNVKETHLSKQIPQFAMQIAIENALKHNVSSDERPLLLELFSSDLSIVIRNNINSRGNSVGYGIGLANLSKRYQLISNNQIAINKDENIFEIQLPLL